MRTPLTDATGTRSRPGGRFSREPRAADRVLIKINDVGPHSCKSGECSLRGEVVLDRFTRVSPFTVAQLARAVGISIREIRDYLERGLLPGPRRIRGRGGDVAFHQEHVDRLVFIGRALAAGFDLDHIARLVDPSGLVTCNDVYLMADDRLKQLRQELGDDVRPCVSSSV